MSRLGRPVEDDRFDESEADEAVFSPFDHRGNQDAALEPNMDLCAGRQFGLVITHYSAFRDVVDSEVEWRAIDEQLQIATVGGHSGKAALIGRSSNGPTPRRRGSGLVPGRLGKWHRRSAKTAVCADPPNVPVRAAAARTAVRLISPVNDVVTALGETSREAGRSAFVDQNI